MCKKSVDTIKQWLLVAIALSFSACQSSEKDEILKLCEPTTLEAIEYDEEVIMGNPWGMKEIGNKLMLTFPSFPNNPMKILDTKTGKLLQEWGAFGNGPYEFQSCLFWGADDKNNILHLYDEPNATMKNYHWKERGDSLYLTKVEEVAYEERVDRIVIEGMALEGGKYVTTAAWGVDKPILLLDEKMDSLANFGDLPEDGHKFERLDFFSGRFDSYKNTFVFAALYIGYLAYYELTPDSVVKKRWSHFLQKPVYTDKGVGGLDRTIVKEGFVGVTMNDKYIFLSYSGSIYDAKKVKEAEIYPENILMFDHKGKLLRNFYTKGHRISRIALSNDGKTLYALSMKPEYRIVRFDISEYV